MATFQMRATLEFLSEAIAHSKIECLHMAHLSKDCNNINLVLENSRKIKREIHTSRNTCC